MITTNSLRQIFNRKVQETHLADLKTPLSLIFAIHDHPWVDASDGAAVRIAMTVAEKDRSEGHLFTVASESKTTDANEVRDVSLSMASGTILADLRLGADVAGAKALKANAVISSPGVKLHGAGFITTRAEASALGLGKVSGLDAHVREYRNGRNLTATPRDVLVIDLFGLTEAQVRGSFPAVYQHVLDKVKPERDQNNRDSYKKNWWVHGEPRKDLRPVLANLPRHIATPVTAKHRFFAFWADAILADDALVCIGSDDAFLLSALSSRIHQVWAIHSGSTLEDRPRYLKISCFDPFPTPSEPLKARLRQLGEDLDAHRKAQQAQHPKLTLTAMYNCLEKLRAGERIEGRDKETYDQGLIGILKGLHDQIHADVAEAYGWPAGLSDDEILHNLVALNRSRAAEEAQGQIRWLRPEYQNPAGQTAAAQGEQTAMDIGPVLTTDKAAWPKTMPEQIAAVRAALSAMGEATPD